MISKDQMETLRDNFQDFLKKKLQMLQLNSIRFLDKNINFRLSQNAQKMEISCS